MRLRTLFSTLLICFLATILSAQDSNPQKQMHIRVDLYDLPVAEALEIQQGVSLSPDQSKTIEEINTMVENDEAKFVASALLTSPVNSRAKFEDTEDVLVIETFEWNEEAKELVPKFIKQSAGTTFEVDPNLTSDGKKLEVNFALEHHTSPPVNEEIMVPLGKSEKSREVTVTRFFRKKITTKILMESGTTALVGAFEITGPDQSKKSEAEPEFKRLVFLYAELFDSAIKKSD